MRKCDSCGCVVNDKNLMQVPSSSGTRHVCKVASKCAKQRGIRMDREAAEHHYESVINDATRWDEQFNPNSKRSHRR